jgi:hypothetical protein
VLRLLALAIGAIFKPKALLIAENHRQQLMVLQRRHPRPRLSDTDRGLAASGLEDVLELAIFSSSKRRLPGDPGRASGLAARRRCLPGSTRARRVTPYLPGRCMTVFAPYSCHRALARKDR